MNAFDYAAPQHLDDALALLASAPEGAAVLAGGTDLLTSMKQGIIAPKRLVSLRRIEELKGVEVSGDTIKVGAMTTFAELVSHEGIKKRFPCLTTAARGVGSPQIMNMGTVAGDLCQHPRCWYYRNGFGLLGTDQGKPLVPDGDNRYHAIFGNSGPAKFVSASSLGPAFIALDAKIAVRGPKGQSRETPAANFFKTPASEKDPFVDLAPGDVVTHVTIPAAPVRNATYEIRERQGLDWPLVTATVAYRDVGSAAQQVWVVLGHVAPVPWISNAAAKSLENKAVDEAAALACGQAATQGAAPLSRNRYKVQLVKVAVKRAALAAAQA